MKYWLEIYFSLLLSYTSVLLNSIKCQLVKKNAPPHEISITYAVKIFLLSKMHIEHIDTC